MGRRAADVTTPVPVLGVPALVGVHAWKATGGDRSGGALLHTWGLHCSIGVQTSPGISRPPAQLSDTPSSPSESITPTSSGYVSRETEYGQILLLTNTDRDKRAPLKAKSGESRSKKEVTFKALGGEAPVDVACSRRSISGTFCYARAIKTNPHVAGSGKNARPRLKAYINGSVVDSEAIGGISVDDGEAEPAKGPTFGGGSRVGQRGHDARPLVVPQVPCGHCGGRQTVVGSPCADASLHVDGNRTLERRNEDAGFRKHPGGPVPCRGPAAASSGPRAAGEAPPVQPAALPPKWVTVTRATIETTQAAAGMRLFAGGKIPRPTSLTLTPQTPTAARPNGPQSLTLPLRASSLQSSYSPRNARSEGKTGVTAQHERMHTMYRSQVNILPNGTSLKCPTSCEEAEASDPTHASEATTQASPAGPQVKLSSKVKVSPSGFPTFAIKTPQHTSSPQLSATAPQSTLNPPASSLHASIPRDAKSDAQIRQIQPHSSLSDPSLHVTAAAVIAAPTSTTAPNSRAKLPAITPLSSTSACSSAAYGSSTGLKSEPATVRSSPAAPTGNQTDACGSRAASLQSAETRQRVLGRNARDVRVESGVYNEVRNSNASSKIHDARAHGLKSKFPPDAESDTDKSKCNGNLINELVVYEPQDRGNSNLSQVTNLQNYISLMKSGSSCLRGCINTEQQRQAHYQGYTEMEREGHCGPCPPVKTAQETELKTAQFASGKSARHANIKLKSDADKQTHPNYSSPSTVARTNCTKSSPADANVHVDAAAHCDSNAPPAPIQRLRAPSTRTGPECRPTPVARARSELGPAPPWLPAHSHPAGAALLLPPSPQCCRSAALHQRLETVEASLAANKARITTLLNIIHDLETCHAPASGRRGCETGQDLKNCSTCQKTACIVYSLNIEGGVQHRC
ncbi:uncharacterized protein LOC114869969 isoform X2 [Betta splendens]|uniref:Uncharacterized protein LOC114869969 isoform X2 n=1 Tax=Betta splendens TaxID=158456 RepID=A0A6P7PW24_BETSP|nr:uncharacterized protein LOC114869969 isoform X2 [Betta splendens]